MMRSQRLITRYSQIGKDKTREEEAAAEEEEDAEDRSTAISCCHTSVGASSPPAPLADDDGAASINNLNKISIPNRVHVLHDKIIVVNEQAASEQHQHQQ